MNHAVHDASVEHLHTTHPSRAVWPEPLASAKSFATFSDSLPRTEQAVIDAALSILGRRLRHPGEAISTPSTVKSYLTLQLSGEQRELFAVLYLDPQHCVISFEIPFAGTPTQTSVFPREIVRRALELNAAAVIFSHNHPSGIPTPSSADKTLTSSMKTALSMIDVRVLDHIIVAGTSSVSMAEKGLL